MVAVELTPTLTDAHKVLVQRYLGEADRFSLAEWVTLLEAFTRLAVSRVRSNQETLTFQAFYDRFIDSPKSDALITINRVAEAAAFIRAVESRTLRGGSDANPFYT